MPVATLIDTFEAFGSPVFRVSGPRPVRRNRSVGHNDGHFDLYFVVGSRKDWVRVETVLESHWLAGAISHLVANAAIQSPLRFPLDLTVTRSEVLLPVDGKEVSFTAYSCRRLAFAVAEIDGRWLYLHAPKRLLRRLSIARERPADLRRFLARMDERMKPHYRATEANIRKRLQAELGDEP